MSMRKIKPETYKEMGLEMSKPNTPYYPSVGFDANTLPEAKDWKVGKTYDIGLRIVMRGQSQRKGRDGKEHGNFDFDIIGVEIEGEVKGKNSRYTEDGGN